MDVQGQHGRGSGAAEDQKNDGLGSEINEAGKPHSQDSPGQDRKMQSYKHQRPGGLLESHTNRKPASPHRLVN